MNGDVNCANGSSYDINDDDDVKEMTAYCWAPNLEANLQ